MTDRAKIEEYRDWLDDGVASAICGGKLDYAQALSDASTHLGEIFSLGWPLANGQVGFLTREGIMGDRAYVELWSEKPTYDAEYGDWDGDGHLELWMEWEFEMGYEIRLCSQGIEEVTYEGGQFLAVPPEGPESPECDPHFNKENEDV